MREIDMIALAGLLHDIGKFGQRAENYPLREGAYKPYDYRYKHAAYTAKVLNDMVFNLGDELSDASAMHHNPQNDIQWIIAAADRLASGFERETFEAYNDAYGKEEFTRQRLWYIFNDEENEQKRKGLRYGIDILAPDTIFPKEGNADKNEYDALWKKFEEDMKAIEEKGNSSVDFFTIDYILKKYTSFIPSSTTFKVGFNIPVKANIPLYEHAKATAAFAAVIYKLHENGNDNVLNYYRKNGSCDTSNRDMVMIVGDFFGIQNFIFNNLATAKAAKLLRAKSAYVQILTKIIAVYIVEELGLSYQSIISTHAGKLEILGVNDAATYETIARIQQELDDFFIGEYFGETGIGLSVVPCSLDDFIGEDNPYQNRLRPRIADAVEKRKYQKFDLTRRNPVLEVDEGLDNQNLCPLCSHRKATTEADGEKVCESCSKLVRIGRNLAKSDYLSISKDKGQFEIFAGYYINFGNESKVFENSIAVFDIRNDETFRGYAKWELKSYVKYSEAEERIEELSELALESCGGEEVGVKALMALKGDVDNMGVFIRTSPVTASFARFNFFARMVDYFFSVKASEMMEGRNLYTVFAGGDDIFILGAWDEVIDFAKELRSEFMRFAEGSPLTFSVGMVMTKPNKPVSFIAYVAENGLDAAKSIESKDAVSLFGETVKWGDYLGDFRLGEELAKLPNDDTKAALLYRLLELVRMSKAVKYDKDTLATVWKSKFAYTMRRNMPEASDTFLSTLDEMIEKYPKESKMVLSEYIYKRRKV